MTWGQIRLSLTQQIPTVNLEQISQAIQSVYDAVLSERPWVGLEGESVLTTIAPYIDGTVDVTAGDGAVSGTGVTFTPAMIGRLFAIAGDSTSYTIADVTSGISLVLDRPFEGATALTQGYSIWPDTYDLPVAVQTIRQMTTEYSCRAMGRVDSLAILRQDPTRQVSGPPRYWAPAVDSFETGSPYEVMRRVRLYPSPDSVYSIPYSYRKAARSFDGTNVNESPFAWVADQAIVQGCIAQLLGSPLFAGTPERAASIQSAITGQQVALAAMRRADNLAQGPANLRLPGE